ncbi:MAG: tRNA uridine-5-carboxymethylaminomethyl(34) synthesis GTPase MnmE [Fibrobacter sp.]|nr:tRNA uridine-5-carboxymethylaminomethyl(34) synthesis GTPase MnmE [Fibrobacter sp.]
MNQTIVAPMTPHGVSAIAALRVSGPAVRQVILSLFKNDKPIPRHSYLGTAIDPVTQKSIDSLLYIFFESPNSYTGEDTLELFPHGNPLIVRNLMKAITSLPLVRIAEPGEFTERAFLNGKLDLVQAEAVADVIHSTSISAIDNARRLLRGKFSTRVHELTEIIKDLSIRLELDVDFAEEEVDPDSSSWRPKLENLHQQISRLINDFQSAETANHLPLVVIYGAPNAGKSSLVNALLEEERVLVSSIPGTTRDFVEVRLLLSGGEIRLVDTAGISDQATDLLDSLSMEKSRKIIKEADLKICLIDGTNTATLQTSLDEAAQKNALILISKADLFDLEARKKDFPKDAIFISTKEDVSVHLSNLKSILNEKLFPPRQIQESFWVTSERQKKCLIQAKEGIEKTLDLIEHNPAVELIAFEMQLVRRELLSITGEISSEDILQSIFSGFCIGK